MVEIFGIDKSGVSKHLKNVFESGELEEGAVVAKIATTAPDGKTYNIEHYSLDAILSVGYAQILEKRFSFAGGHQRSSANT